MGHQSKRHGPRPPLFAVPSLPETADAPSTFRDAYQAALPAAQALPLHELVLVNVDVPAAVTIALSCVPGIRTFRQQVAQELPYFDLAHFDQLETFAFATAHAHAKCLVLPSPPSDLERLRKQGMALRSQLYALAAALAELGVLSEASLKTIKMKPGAKHLIVDLRTLVDLLRMNWDSAGAKSAVEPKQLDDAESLARRLLDALGAHGQAQIEASAILQQRQRNFTLLMRAHRQVRRAIAYIRADEGDLEQIVPTLYRARRTGRRRASQATVKAE